MVFVVFLYQIVSVSLLDGAEYRADGLAQRQSYVTVAADRGTIFDRDGNEMSITVPALSIYANPKAVGDPVATAHVLAQMLGIDAVGEAELAEKMSDRSKTFVYVQRFVEDDVAEAILSLGLAGVNGVTEPKRVQVSGGLARNVVGRTDPFGEGSTGLELQYEKVLRGTDGLMIRETNNSGRTIPGASRMVEDARPGTDLVLTIDRSMQYQVEQALLRRVEELVAKGGNAVVLDTESGEVLAIASVGRNGEGVAEVTSGNMAAVEAHEPGSVAKIFSVASAIDQGAVNPSSMFLVPGVYVFDEGTDFEQTIKDAYPHDTEPMSLRQILVNSSNIGTMMAAETIGVERLHEYLTSFGFGSATGLQYPGESSGTLRSVDRLRGSEKATITYGYGFAATSLQLVSAVNAVANGGVYVPPRLVRSTIDEHGKVWETPMGESHRVISESTAATMSDLLGAVVCTGTGSRAQVPGITVAGKTGTGYKVQDNGTYVTEDGSRAYFATFVGYLPADNPRVTILVSIDEPNPSSRDRFGGTAAAPVFSALAQVAIQELSIEPSDGDVGCVAAE
ncbi:MAG: penicillin-binding protein 2 [Actinomycetota bacterium]|nr:penicillin-binding protein 2 [Actinomycetota bacterium]MDA2971497.1 penicillin-binding protein 2 [Actinomycetota bacterium]MDA3000720.1 penicillin-binding protein 2 [Actinomycetota bacterium]